jgi:hypothetical protein
MFTQTLYTIAPQNIMDQASKFEKSFIRIDWKESISDFFFIAKSNWKLMDQISDDTELLELIENYNSEPTEDFLLAVGQELTRFDLMLIEILEDADHYCLYLFENSESEKITAQLKKENKKFRILKQPRRKIGSSAKRIDLANQIPHKKYELKGVSWLKYPFTFSTQYLYENGARIGEKNYIVDFRELPPTLTPSEKITALEYNSELNLYAAIFADLASKTGTLKISSNPTNKDSWKTIQCDDNLHMLSKIGWLDNIVLVIRERQVWKYEYTPDYNNKCEYLYLSHDQSSSVFGTFPAFIKTQSGEHLILLFTQFYSFKNGILTPTGIYAEEHSDFNYFNSGPNSIIYGSKKELIEVDFRVKQTRKRLLFEQEQSYCVRTFDNEWAALTKWGRTDKDHPIAIFWNPKKDEWRTLQLGSLGKYGIRDIHKIDDNVALVLSNEEFLIEIKDLNSIFSETKFLSENYSNWDIAWPITSEEPITENQIVTAKSNHDVSEHKSTWLGRLLGR